MSDKQVSSDELGDKFLSGAPSIVIKRLQELFLDVIGHDHKIKYLS